MKIQFDREHLLNKLLILATIVPKKPVIAAHSHFLMNIKGGVASITSTDGQKQITVSCDTTKCEGDVKFTVPAKLLVNTLMNLIDSDIKLTITHAQVALKCGKSAYKLPSEDGESYPLIPEINSDFEASFNGALFNEGLETAKKYTDSENSVVAQQGVYLRFDNGKMNAYGFKGFEICKVIITPRSVNKWDEILIPTGAVKTFINCVSDSDIVDVSHDKKRIEVRTESVSIVALVLDVKYPRVEKFYSERPDTCVKHNTVQFLQALKRLQPYAREESPLLAIDIRTTMTRMTVDNAEFAHNGEEEIDSVATEECRIGMNVNFMVNALSSFTNDEFYIYYSKPDKPLYIEPVNLVKDNDKFILLAAMGIKE